MKRLFNATSVSTLCFICILLSSAVATAAAPSPNGAEVFNNNCARCHNARSIDEFSLAEWAVIMPHMREKAHLTGRETESVLEFITLIKNGDEAASRTSQTAQLSGKDLFGKYSCQGCHQVGGQGGSVGPALDGVVRNKGKEFVSRKLKDPQFNLPSSPMPKMPMNDEEIRAVVEFLDSL